MSTEANAKIFSVIGGCRRSGRWLVPANTNMMTLFGRAFIDLREARTSAEELEFTCLSVFANVTFIVPEGAEVRPSGMAILGSSRSTVPVTEAACQLPPISVDATTVFGRMRIRTTDTDPEDDERKKHKRRWFRRSKRSAQPDQAAPAAITGIESPERAGGVDLAAPERSDAVEYLDGVTPRRTPAAPSPSAPHGSRPSRPVLDDDEVIGAGPPAVSTPADLSAPIPAFEDDDVSPIHEVAVPDTLEGTVAVATDDATDDDADPDQVSGPPVFAADDEPRHQAHETADDDGETAGVAGDEAATADVVG